jgi:hypothetical protein
MFCNPGLALASDFRNVPAEVLNHNHAVAEEVTMRLSVKALALSFGITWAVLIFLVGICHLIWPSYGTAMLQLAASVYPGYSVGGFGSVIWGTLYAFVDGLIFGAVLAWLYNTFLGAKAEAA